MTFDPQTLESQRAARAMIKHEARILTPIGAAGFVLLLILSIALARVVPIYAALIAFAVYYVAFRAVMNWRQWAALQKYRLACPHCGLLLAEQIHYFKTPTFKCPHCGEIAWAQDKPQARE